MIQYWLKGTDRAVIRQYFVNFVTLRIRYLFSTVRCPQNPFNSLFDSSSTDVSPKICCFEWLTNTHTWLFRNEVNSVTFYRVFNLGCIAEIIYI